MTRTQWIIIGVLSMAVLFVFCIAGVLAVMTFSNFSEQTTSAFREPTATVPPQPSSAPRPTVPPTFTLPPPATMTRVIDLAPKPAVTPQAVRTRMPSAIQDAWDKSAQAKSARFELGITMQGNLMDVPDANANQELALLNLTGAKNGQDTHLVMKGYLALFLTGDANKGLELIMLGDNLYVKGPLPLLGAAEDKWYFSKRDQLKTTGTLSLDSADALAAQNPDWTGFKQTTTETLDAVRCNVYTGDKTTTMRFFQSLSAEAPTDLGGVDEVDSAETKFWVCADGYLRQFSLALAGHSKNKPSQSGTVQIRARFTELNSATVKITPPPNSVPLTIPGIVPTKTK